jgi:YegS/Rv2252/BmrU family lipid kinase
MSRQRILFIINPISGVFKKEGIPERIAKYLDYVKYDFTINYTQYPGHATEMANEAVKDGYSVVVAVGGDGSVNEVARGLLGSDVALGVIPFGSGNGMAGHLKLPIRNAKKAIEVLNTGKVTKIDAVKTNYGYFFSVGGFGFDAHAARRFRSQVMRGFFSYFLASVREIFYHFRPEHAKIQIDGIELEREVYLFTAFNSSQYGYKLGVFPTTSMHDGRLDVILVRSFPLTRLFKIFLAIFLKRPDLVPEAESFRAKKIKIYANPKRVYQFDGDHFITHEDVEMEIEPNALNIIVPYDFDAY